MSERLLPVNLPARNPSPPIATGHARWRRRDSRIFEKAPDGHYVEPHWFDVRLFEVEMFGAPGARILDPACGWGRIPKAAAAAGYTAIASDIVDRLDRELVGDRNIDFSVCDFLNDPPACAKPWSVVTNPHFDHIQEFAERALEVAIYKVAVIVPLRRLPAAHWLERMPLESVWLLTPRPSMPPGDVVAALLAAGKEPSGGKEDFAWLIFNNVITPVTPRIRWLHRDRKRPHR